MSYLSDRDLDEELRRLCKEAGYHDDVSLEEPREFVTFHVQIADLRMAVAIPEDELHSSPLSFVSEAYLKPLVARALYLHSPPEDDE